MQFRFDRRQGEGVEGGGSFSHEQGRQQPVCRSGRGVKLRTRGSYKYFVIQTFFASMKNVESGHRELEIIATLVLTSIASLVVAALRASSAAFVAFGGLGFRV